MAERCDAFNIIIKAKRMHHIIMVLKQPHCTISLNVIRSLPISQSEMLCKFVNQQNGIFCYVVN